MKNTGIQLHLFRLDTDTNIAGMLPEKPVEMIKSKPLSRVGNMNNKLWLVAPACRYKENARTNKTIKRTLVRSAVTSVITSEYIM